MRFAECADRTQIVIHILWTLSSLQGIITSCMHFVHSGGSREKSLWSKFFQDIIHPEFKISISFLRITLFSVNNILPDIFCQSLNIQIRCERQHPPIFPVSSWSPHPKVRSNSQELKGIMRNKTTCMSLPVLYFPGIHQKDVNSIF